MKKISHIIWTFALSLWIFDFFFHLGILWNLLYSIITAFFSFLPDVDIRIVNYLKKMNWKTLFLSYPLYLFVKTFLKHRTITHSIWFALVFLGFYWYVGYLFLFTFFLAIILHIFEDSLTISGVYPFFPLKLKLRLGWYSTNSTFDEIILNIFGFIIGFLFIIYYFI